MLKITCTEFVKRQTVESPFSYYEGSWEELEELVVGVMREHAIIEGATEGTTNAAPFVRAGYKPGVQLVTVPARVGNADTGAVHQFYSGVVELTADTQLSAKFKARRDGEAPFVDVVAHGAKTPAKHVDVVLYSRALLVEEGEQVPSDVDYQIVSINARTQDEPEPMSPIAMARNFLALPGGTKAEYTAEQFAQAIVYWSTHAMHGGSK